MAVSTGFYSKHRPIYYNCSMFADFPPQIDVVILMEMLAVCRTQYIVFFFITVYYEIVSRFIPVCW